MTSFRLAEIAERIGAQVQGPAGAGEVRVERVRTLDAAEPSDLSFLTRAAHRTSYREAAERSRAAALLVGPEDVAGLEDRPLLVVDDPSAALIPLLELFHPIAPPTPGVHPTAVVDGAEIDPAARIGPYVVLGKGTRVGARARLDAHVVVGRECEIGPDTVLHPHVVLYDRTVVGARTVVHAGTVLGADGFGYVTRGGAQGPVHHKVPQVGRTVLGEDVEIGALSAVDRAALEETRIGDGSKIDNLVQVGHNVVTGRGCILCGQVGIAGSARLGNYVVLGGQSGSAGHLELGDGVQVAGKSAVFESVPAGRKVGGSPAIELGRWKRQTILLERLGEWSRRLRGLEKRLAQTDAKD